MVRSIVPMPAPNWSLRYLPLRALWVIRALRTPSDFGCTTPSSGHDRQPGLHRQRRAAQQPLLYNSDFTIGNTEDSEAGITGPWLPHPHGAMRPGCSGRELERSLGRLRGRRRQVGFLLRVAVGRGVGARLDFEPDLIFTLRGVDAQDMIAKAGAHLATLAPVTASDKVLAGEDMSALFGLAMAEEATPAKAAGPAEAAANMNSDHAVTSIPRKAVGRRAGVRSAKSKQRLVPERRSSNANEKPTRQPQDNSARSAGSTTAKSCAHLEALIGEATADAYSEAEQAVGFYTTAPSLLPCGRSAPLARHTSCRRVP